MIQDRSMQHRKKLMYVLMTGLVFAWGLDYVFAKQALQVLHPMTLLFFKYCCGIVVVFLVKTLTKRKDFIRKKDLKVFICCAIFGQISYFFFEYAAMDYLPVSLITIVLAFVPAFAILVERVLYKRKITRLMAIGVIACAGGVAMVIGVNYRILFEGRLIGYILAFCAVFAWNIYNFMTESLSGRYDGISLTFNQLCCTVLLLAPYGLSHLPSAELVTPGVVGGVFYLGAISGAFGFMIEIQALHYLGVTRTSLYSNFLPITTTLFGWLILGETITGLQMLGGAVVIAAACLVIREKGKAELPLEESAARDADYEEKGYDRL